MAKNKKEGDSMRKNPIKDLDKYRKFLEKIPLAEHREKLKDVKWVEQDLPKEILPLASIFKYYWETRDFLNFEKWKKCLRKKKLLKNRRISLSGILR